MTAVAVAQKAIPGADKLKRLFRRILDAAPRPMKRNEESQKKQLEIQQQAASKVAAYRLQFDNRINDLAKRLGEGKITPRIFRALMLIEIRYLLFTAAAAGAGGVGYLQPSDIALIDRRVRQQAQYLDNWISQLERKSDKSSVAQITNRARMYGGESNSVLNEMIDRVAHRAFPTMPFQPGRRTDCLTNCKCKWEWHVIDFRKGDADVFWRMRPAEHCDTCLARAKALAPLKIRDFRIINMPLDRNLLISKRGA